MNGFARQRRRLAWLLGAIFTVLVTASLVLVVQSFGRLRYEAVHGQRVLAEDVVARANLELARLVAVEEARPPTDYDYLVVSGERYVQRSPLSSLSPDTLLPGVLGYFQVDSRGRFSTPLLPLASDDAESLALTEAEVVERQRRQELVRRLLEGDRESAAEGAMESSAEPDLLGPSSAPSAAPASRGLAEETPPGDARVTRNIFEQLRGAEAFSKADRRAVRQVILDTEDADERIVPRLEAFLSAVGPLSLAWLDQAHLVLYRKVWLEGQFVQGVVIEQGPFIDHLIGRAFAGSRLAHHAGLAVSFDERPLRSYAPQAPAHSEGLQLASAPGEALLRSRLTHPANSVVLTFTAVALPLGAGAVALMWISAVMALVLCAGFAVLYLSGRHQIRLAEQQQDFVAAVSHELKTPLTSIRMYGEILKAGWADDVKRQSYYDYILSEAERLSRLIGNVLELARITRSDSEKPALKELRARELLDQVETNVASRLEGAGVVLERAAEAGSEAAVVLADEDGFLQVMINLIDNAIKFSRGAERQVLELGCRLDGAWVEFRVRDYGPGVPKTQVRRIFELFYRGGHELTRETAGTGIGLALVRALVERMDGVVDVVNRQPGAEFRVRLRRFVAG